jgi:hypothetical protein
MKTVTFVARSASVNLSEFGRLWRRQADERLAALPADAMPVRLVHYVARPRRSSVCCDGVAVAWFDDVQEAIRHQQWDADRSGSGPSVAISQSSFVVEERIVSGGDWLDDRWSRPDPEPTAALIGCIQAVPGLTRGQFRDYWWDQHRPLADRLIPDDVGTTAYVHNYVLDESASRWAGIGEMYERSMDTARRRGDWFASEAARPLLADEDRFLVRATRQVLVTDQEVVMGHR